MAKKPKHLQAHQRISRHVSNLTFVKSIKKKKKKKKKEGSSETGIRQERIPAAKPSGSISGLQPATSYHIYITAANLLGNDYVVYNHNMFHMFLHPLSSP